MSTSQQSGSRRPEPRPPARRNRDRVVARRTAATLVAVLVASVLLGVATPAHAEPCGVGPADMHRAACAQPASIGLPPRAVTSTGTPKTRSTAPAGSGHTGTVRTTGGSVRLRAGASIDSAVVGSVASGSPLSIACAVTGATVAGTVATTNQWDWLTGGSYLSHAYVASGVIPACPGDGGTMTPAPSGTVTPTPFGTGTPEPNGTMTHAQFIAASVAPAQRTHRDLGVPASVTIAQAIVESGWGASGLAVQDHNFFGIKCAGGNRGKLATRCRTYQTTECTPTCAASSASFRVYASVADSYRDHALFLTGNARYRQAFEVTNNADEFLRRIWRAGYVTDPSYDKVVIAMMRQYQLYQYDQI